MLLEARHLLSHKLLVCVLNQLQWRCLKMFISWIYLVDMHACHMCHVYMYPMVKCFGHICCVVYGQRCTARCVSAL